MKTNKLKIIKTIFLFGIISLGYSCSQNKGPSVFKAENIMLEDVEETNMSEEIPALESGTSRTEKKNIPAELKIIKSANCRIKVVNVEKATLLAREIALKYQGYISDEQFRNTNYTKENSFTIRIPKNDFDAVLDSVCGLAQFIDHKNITTTDVTEEYVDITTRLKTKLEVKQRYEAILRAKAKTVEDLLKTEEKLSVLQEEIEVAQGRLHYLSNKVSYSTIQVDMYETIIPKKLPEVYEPGYMDKAKEGLSFGWSIVENITLSLFYIWPFLIIVIFVLVYFKWIRKRKK